MRKSVGYILLLGFLIFSPLSLGDLHAQVGDSESVPWGTDLRETSLVGIGYTTNAPRQLLGGSALVLGKGLRNWGLYADVKTWIDTPEDEPGFTLALTPEDAARFGDTPLGERSTWRSVNVALVRVVAAGLAVYAGGGYSEEMLYRRYFNPERERGESGHYWVRDAPDPVQHINVMGGAWFRVTSRFLFQFGVERAPRGITAGITYTLNFGS